MPRLIDDIRAGEGLRAPWFVNKKAEAWTKLAEMLGKVLLHPGPDLPVLLIDNVADYYYTASDQEHWSVDRDFPNLAPPFPAFWCEHKMPRTIHSKECGDTKMNPLIQHGRVGILVHGLTPEQFTAVDIPANGHWVLWCELFVDYGFRDRPIEGPHGSMFLCLDEQGAVIGAPWMQSYADAGYEDVMKSFMTWLHPTLLAISFLHCKNVRVEDNQVPKPLAKKYRERHRGVQPTAYKTLVIEPLKQILRTEGKSGEHGLAKAMHICRGHFRDYRQGRGLFGKYKQLVWTPMTVRGTKGKEAPPREIEVKL